MRQPGLGMTLDGLGGLPHSPSQQIWCEARQDRAGAQETHVGLCPPQLTATGALGCQAGLWFPITQTSHRIKASLCIPTSNHRLWQREKEKTNTWARLWVSPVMVLSGNRSSWGILPYILGPILTFPSLSGQWCCCIPAIHFYLQKILLHSLCIS